MIVETVVPTFRVRRDVPRQSEKGIDDKGLAARIRNPIPFRPAQGGKVAHGYEATILADTCDFVLTARKAEKLQKQQDHIADQCELLLRGFARVGIIALVDEATGYQYSRTRNSLARILEAFVTKELQPWVKTFPDEYYAQLFRLRGLPYSADSVKRPQYFGTLTNDIVWKRIAPGVDRTQARDPKNRFGSSQGKFVSGANAKHWLPKAAGTLRRGGRIHDNKPRLSNLHQDA
jgi:hypothetical protein